MLFELSDSRVCVRAISGVGRYGLAGNTKRQQLTIGALCFEVCVVLRLDGGDFACVEVDEAAVLATFLEADDAVFAKRVSSLPRPTWVMGYDLDPVRTIAERKRFYERAIPEGWLVLFTHDHERPMGMIGVGEKGKPVLVKA